MSCSRLLAGFIGYTALCTAVIADGPDTGFGPIRNPYAQNFGATQAPSGAQNVSNAGPFGNQGPGGIQAGYTVPPTDARAVQPAQYNPSYVSNSSPYNTPAVGAAAARFAAMPGMPAPSSPPPSGPATLSQTVPCNQCDDGSCASCRGSGAAVAGCQECPKIGFEAFQGFDTFRGPPEGTGPSNFGEVTGANAAIPVYEPWGIGWQLGASYGLYDFSGRPAVAPQVSTTGAQQQIFVTTGFFRRAKQGQKVSFGIVHDWMINNNYSQYAVSPTISQWRGQVEWMASANNAYGLWGAVRDKSYIGDRPDNHNQFRGIDQINAFWHHKYAFGGDTWLRIGMPLSKRMQGGGLAGSAIVGANALVPLNHQLALYANSMYMAPNFAPGPLGSSHDAYNVAMGIAWYPGRVARTSTVSGACWLPYMPLGNNGNFLVDSSHFD